MLCEQVQGIDCEALRGTSEHSLEALSWSCFSAVPSEQIIFIKLDPSLIRETLGEETSLTSLTTVSSPKWGEDAGFFQSSWVLLKILQTLLHQCWNYGWVSQNQCCIGVCCDWTWCCKAHFAFLPLLQLLQLLALDTLQTHFY